MEAEISGHLEAEVTEGPHSWSAVLHDLQQSPGYPLSRHSGETEDALCFHLVVLDATIFLLFTIHEVLVFFYFQSCFG